MYYNKRDIGVILTNSKRCFVDGGVRICKDVRAGKFKYNTTDLASLWLVRNMLQAYYDESIADTCIENTDKLVDHLQDICRRCKITVITPTVFPDTGCDVNAVISEDEDCIITEDGDDVIIE